MLLLSDLVGGVPNLNIFVEKLNEASSAASYRILESNSIGTILTELHLEEKFFVVLVNGKRSELDFRVDPGDEILILPKMAGG